MTDGTARNAITTATVSHTVSPVTAAATWLSLQPFTPYLKLIAGRFNDVVLAQRVLPAMVDAAFAGAADVCATLWAMLGVSVLLGAVSALVMAAVAVSTVAAVALPLTSAVTALLVSAVTLLVALLMSASAMRASQVRKLDVRDGNTVRAMHA
ncbi:hypothetical protein [Bifidobacterium leontopitheci]|uniref:Uncharacterized protein n=1 Tax=Bifidobacterium leontopitheci TaxID=2650774 RepID=A0A6I1GF78_9BIFI|nr:hypothetical protein [Bifidobacterium leontopitheci]KAB7790284.1 hypothetical protein F7D09_1180 [Bifidobacterium leontopitheci]